MHPVDSGIEDFAILAFHRCCVFFLFIFVSLLIFFFLMASRKGEGDGPVLFIEVFCFSFVYFPFNNTFQKFVEFEPILYLDNLWQFLVVILFLCVAYWVLGKTKFMFLYSAIFCFGTWKISIQNPFYSYLTASPDLLCLFKYSHNVWLLSELSSSTAFLLYRWSNLIGCYLH